MCWCSCIFKLIYMTHHSTALWRFWELRKHTVTKLNYGNCNKIGHCWIEMLGCYYHQHQQQQTNLNSCQTKMMVVTKSPHWGGVVASQPALIAISRLKYWGKIIRKCWFLFILTISDKQSKWSHLISDHWPESSQPTAPPFNTHLAPQYNKHFVLPSFPRHWNYLETFRLQLYTLQFTLGTST